MDTLDLDQILLEKIEKVLQKKPQNKEQYRDYLKQEGIDLKLVNGQFCYEVAEDVRTSNGIIPERIKGAMKWYIPHTDETDVITLKIQSFLQDDEKIKIEDEIHKEVRKLIDLKKYYIDELGVRTSFKSFVKVLELKGISVDVFKNSEGETDFMFSKQGVECTALNNFQDLDDNFYHFVNDLKRPELTEYLADIRDYLGEDKEYIDFYDHYDHRIGFYGIDLNDKEKKTLKEKENRDFVVEKTTEILDHFWCVKNLGLIEKTSMEDFENQLKKRDITFDIRKNNYGREQVFCKMKNGKEHHLFSKAILICELDSEQDPNIENRRLLDIEYFNDFMKEQKDKDTRKKLVKGIIHYFVTEFSDRRINKRLKHFYKELAKRYIATNRYIKIKECGETKIRNMEFEYVNEGTEENDIFTLKDLDLLDEFEHLIDKEEDDEDCGRVMKRKTEIKKYSNVNEIEELIKKNE